MFDKLSHISARYDELTMLLGSPDVIADQDTFQRYIREHAEIEPITMKFKEYEEAIKRRDQALELLEIPDMAELAEDELSGLAPFIEKLEKEIRLLLLPKDPNDERNVIVEIRAGTGGEEASLFASNLMRMYFRYAERQGWKVEVTDISETELGGVKEAVFEVSGRGVYSRLKYESGVHRVQRIPSTESGGRIHTSAATVAVLPEAEEVEVSITPNEIRVDVFHAGGHGGQSVNTTDSAVRVTHIPTGLVVVCQDEKSQIKNREKAVRVLRARLYDRILAQRNDEVSSNRRSQVGSGDRSERIRTYNFPQGRVTDHRVNLTIYRIDEFIEGDMEEVIRTLVEADQAERLRNLSQ